VVQISLRFHACVIDAEGVATDDEGDYFSGAVDFDMVIDGRIHRGLSAKVKQAAGSRFEDGLEILSPSRYEGPLNYTRYRDCVERYVRDQVASQLAKRRTMDRPSEFHDLRLPGEAACSFVA